MQNKTNDGYYEAFWPRTARQQKVKPLAKRLDTLEGKTIAQLWDYAFRGDKVFEILEDSIKKQYPNARFISWREFGNTHGNDEAKVMEDLPRLLKKFNVDAVISSMAC